MFFRNFNISQGEIAKLIFFAISFIACQLAVAMNSVTNTPAQNPTSTAKQRPVRSITDLDRAFQFYNISEFDTALIYFDKAFKKASRLRDTTTLVKALGGQGRIFSDKGENPRALSYYQNALNLAERANKPSLTAHLEKDVGVLYINWKNFDKALEHYNAAQRIAAQLNDLVLLADCFNNKAVVYEQKLDYPKALDYYKKALDYYLKLNNQKGIAKVYSNIAIIFKSQNKFQEAITYNLKSLKIIQAIGNKWMESATLNNIGSVYYSMGRYAQTITYCERSLKLAKSINAKEIEVACFETLADAAAKLGDYKLAYQYRVMFHKLDKDFINAEKTKQFSELEIKYHTVKREKQISLLNKQSIIQKLSISRQKTTIGIVLGAMISIVIIGLLLFNRNRLKQQAHLRRQEMKQREILAQSVISAEENERKRIASDLHDGVGQLLSAVKMNFGGLIDRIEIAKDSDRFLVERTMALVDESCREVRHISHQMMPGTNRRSGIAVDIREFVEKVDAESLKIDLHVEGFGDTLEGDEEIILYRVIQEAINNVIKHSGASHLLIQLVKTKHLVSVTMTDNGRGFDTSRLYDGIGLKNIITRVEYLKGKVAFESEPGTGTTVKVEVPL